MNKTIIIAVGKIAAGKSVVSDYLVKKHNAEYIKLTQFLNDILASQGITNPTRQNQQDLGDALRKEHGPQHLATLAIQKAQNSTNKIIVFDSVKNPGEIALIKSELGKDNVLVIGVESPDQMRYKRILERMKYADVGDTPEDQLLEKIIREDARESDDSKKQPHQLDNAGCLQLADVTIDNYGDLEVFESEIRASLKRFLG